MKFAELEELALSWSPESREGFRKVRKLFEEAGSLGNPGGHPNSSTCGQVKIPHPVELTGE